VRRPIALLGLGAAALAVLAMAVAACGGGGGGGGGPTGPPPPATTIVFTPAGGGNVVLASGAGTQGTTLSLEVRTTGIQDLYGLAFHLAYPVAALRLTGHTEGSVLNAGGTVPTSFQIVDSPPGNLVVGLTRLGKVSGTAASGTLMTLQLTAAASGTGNLAFSSNVASDSQGNVISGLAWAGGSVQVTLVPGSRR
jgi:Cohesin domain